MAQPGSTPPATPRRVPAGDRFEAAERVLLATTLFVVPIALTTGFSRYETFKLGVLSALAVALGGAAVAGFCRGRGARLLPTGLALSALALLFVHLAGLAWAPLFAAGLPRLAPAAALTIVLLSAASRKRAPGWVAVPLAAAAVVVALSVLLQRFGVLNLPAMPTGFAEDAGAHGVFDHARHAATFLTVTAPLGLFWAATRPPEAGWASVVAALVASVLSYAALGVCGGPGVVVAGVALVAGLLLGLRHLAGTPRALQAWGGAVASLVALAGGAAAIGGPEPDPEAAIAALARSSWDEFGLGTQENTVTSASEWSFEAARVRAVWEAEGLVGAGLGAWAVEAGRAIDPEHPYYVAGREPYIHQTPPSIALGVAYELGVIGVLALAGFVLAALGTLLRGALARGDEPRGAAEAAGRGFAIASGASALVMFLLTPAAYHAGEGVAVAACLGLAAAVLGPAGGALGVRTIAPAESGFPRFERWVLAGVPLLGMLLLGAWGAARFVELDFYRQRGNVYLDAGRLRDAATQYERAVAAEPDDAHANYHLGIALYLTPEDDARRQRAARHAQRAAGLAPYDVRIGLAALEVSVLRPPRDARDEAEMLRERRRTLERLRGLDPRNAEVGLELAELHQIAGDYGDALEVLARVIEVGGDERSVARAHLEAAVICQEHTEEPERALMHLEEALRRFGPVSPESRRIRERITEVERWVRDGVRPEPDGHQH
jgi:tetratricopeptide (TPR) repeat protein